jgi:hypothetical protein
METGEQREDIDTVRTKRQEDRKMEGGDEDREDRKAKDKEGGNIEKHVSRS